MKFVYYEEGILWHPGVMSSDGTAIFPLEPVLGRPVHDLQDFIETHTRADLNLLQSAVKEGTGRAVPVESVRLLAPIRRPIHDILCVGANYQDHLQEVEKGVDAGFSPMPQRPVLFSKRASSITGPDDPVESHRQLDTCLDYEVELAVIIGKRGRDIPVEDVEEYIFGYSVFNDISARKLQRENHQWYRGKSLDSFSVMGPMIVHKSALPFPLRLDISTRVNGETRQKSNTSRMIRSTAEIVHLFSMGMTLEPGDIIATGTPMGTGMGFDPPRYMRPGDAVECSIQGIGVLRNLIV